MEDLLRETVRLFGIANNLVPFVTLLLLLIISMFSLKVKSEFENAKVSFDRVLELENKKDTVKFETIYVMKVEILFELYNLLHDLRYLLPDNANMIWPAPLVIPSKYKEMNHDQKIIMIDDAQLKFDHSKLHISPEAQGLIQDFLNRIMGFIEAYSSLESGECDTSEETFSDNDYTESVTLMHVRASEIISLIEQEVKLILNL